MFTKTNDDDDTEYEYSSDSSSGSDIKFEIKSTQCVIEEVEDEITGLKKTLTSAPKERTEYQRTESTNFKKIVKLGEQVRSLSALVKDLQQKVHTYQKKNIDLTDQINSYEEKEFERILEEGNDSHHV